MSSFRLYAVLLITLLVSACATGPKFSETQSAMPSGQYCTAKAALNHS